ncbi:MAG: hypothetical protein P1P63_08320 [Treponemataceae bacterium]
MNEKSFCIFVFIFVLLLSSCRTTGVYDNRAGAGAVGNNIGELGEKQAAAAITGAELKSEIERSLDEVGNLEQTIKCGAGDFEEFKAIVQRIRERGANNAHEKSGAD